MKSTPVPSDGDYDKIRRMLWRYRQAKGVSKTELARLTGYSVHTIYNWERASTMPCVAGLITWANALDFDLRIVVR